MPKKKNQITKSPRFKRVDESIFIDIESVPNEDVETINIEVEKITVTKADIDEIMDNLFKDEREPDSTESKLLNSKSGKVYVSHYLKEYRDKSFPELVDLLLTKKRLDSETIIEIMKPPSDFIASKFVNGFITSVARINTDYLIKVRNYGFRASVKKGPKGKQIIILEKK
jgi:phage terminase large subunit-like protein